jgi:hypothetical protein
MPSTLLLKKDAPKPKVKPKRRIINRLSRSCMITFKTRERFHRQSSRHRCHRASTCTAARNFQVGSHRRPCREVRREVFRPRAASQSPESPGHLACREILPTLLRSPFRHGVSQTCPNVLHVRHSYNITRSMACAATDFTAPRTVTLSSKPEFLVKIPRTATQHLPSRQRFEHRSGEGGNRTYLRWTDPLEASSLHSLRFHRPGDTITSAEENLSVDQMTDSQ